MLFYRLLISLAAPLLVLIARLKGRDDRAMSRERLGGVARARHPQIWVHAASNGELTALRPLLEQLAAEMPLFVTTNSASGRALAQEWGHESAAAPIDLRWAVRRILRRRHIAAYITSEAELWPNRHAVLRKSAIPQSLVAARITRKGARTWARLGCLRRPLLAGLTRIVPQDSASARRLAALGVSHQTAPLDFKALYTPHGAPPPEDWRAAFPRARTWLAASTHEGEEAHMIAAHRAMPTGTRLILAPRHPRRADEVAALLKAAGLSHARSSAGPLASTPDVLLIDELGRMDAAYACAAVCVIGGTWTPRGGHTPHEPRAHGCRLIYGPDTANFRSAFRAAARAGLATRVVDPAELTPALCAAFAAPPPDPASLHSDQIQLTALTAALLAGADAQQPRDFAHAPLDHSPPRT